MNRLRLSRLTRPVLWIALTGASAASASAHDFWIEPGTFRPEAHRIATIGLRVGEAFVGEKVPRNAEKIERFSLIGPEGEKEIVGLDGTDPAGAVRLGGPGLYLAVYRTKRTNITLPAAKFEAYLREEGLDHVLAAREQRGTQKEPGREVYSRCAKSMLLVGAPEGGGTGFDRPAGLRLELVALSNPYALAPGDSLPVTVLYEGAPLAGVKVVAMERGAPQDVASSRTDAKGRATLPLARPGTWLVTCVHMSEAPKGTEADWESLWASLTFEVRSNAIAPAPTAR